MWPRRFVIVATIPFLLLIVGTLGYEVVEGWAAFDALYMTAITITTVGFLEVHPLSHAGRLFTIFLAMGGVFTLFYAATEVIGGIVSGEVRRVLGRQRMERQLAAMKEHRIVCGYGRMGRYVCREFSSLKLPFVLVDRDADTLRGVQMPFGIPLHGDATSDEVLRRAGVERAKVLVAVAPSDADNLYVTLSARLLNEKLFIVARAETEGAEQKLLRAGASRVVAPFVIGGQRVTQAVLRPNVVDFIELATRSEHMELQLEETEIRPSSALAGAALKDSRIRQDLGIIIVAIKKADGRMVYNPAPDERILAGDLLITLGHRQQLDRLAALAGS